MIYLSLMLVINNANAIDKRLDADRDNFTQKLKVFQFNIWQEGEMVPGGYDAVINEIIRADADLVALSEVRNYGADKGRSNLHERLVSSLKSRGFQYYSGYSNDSGILSKYPIKELSQPFPLDRGSITRALVTIGNTDVAFYSAHLDYRNCSIYLPRGYHSSTWAQLDAPVTDIALLKEDNLASMRDEAIDAFLDDAKTQRALGAVVILAGDFNEASHLDWTEETKDMFDHNGVVIKWRNTVALEQAGFVDSYREMYPNPVTHPGFTFPSDNKLMEVSKLAWAPKSDERDRIDFILYHPDPRITLQSSYIVGPRKSIIKNKRMLEQTHDVFIEPLDVWPTDHKAVLSTFELSPNKKLKQ